MSVGDFLVLQNKHAGRKWGRAGRIKNCAILSPWEFSLRHKTWIKAWIRLIWTQFVSRIQSWMSARWEVLAVVCQSVTRRESLFPAPQETSLCFQLRKWVMSVCRVQVSVCYKLWPWTPENWPAPTASWGPINVICIFYSIVIYAYIVSVCTLLPC